MIAPGPRAAGEITAALGDTLTELSDAYGLPVADVAPAAWPAALTAARDRLGCSYFDWLSAVDELGAGFDVVAHVVRLPAPGRPGLRLLVRTRVPRDAAELPTATGVYAGAAWHERETAEMFGLVFTGHPAPGPLLLPDGFEGHPLRKDFVLAARVAKAWPGAKEPGESDTGAPAAARAPGRRRILPPGVPDPAEWGPHREEIAAAEAAGPGGGDTGGAAPQAGPRAGRAGRAPGERPARGDRPRRTRSASQGSASQQPAAAPPEGPAGPRGPEAGRVPGAPDHDGPGPERPGETGDAGDGAGNGDENDEGKRSG